MPLDVRRTRNTVALASALVPCYGVARETRLRPTALRRPVTMRVLFFAHLKDVTGCAETELRLAAPADANELWRQLARRFPELAGFRSSVRLARNCEYVGTDGRFADADEVGLIPPVSGG